MDYWRVVRWNEMVLQQYRDSERMKEKPLNELVERYVDDVESFYSQFSSYYIEK